MGYLRKLRIRLLLGGIGSLLSASLAAAGEPRYWIVVHPDNAVETLTRREISRLFLKKSTHWSNGTPAAPLDLDVRVEAREEFSKDIHGRAAEAIKKYWQRMVFSGKAAPPAEVATEEDMLAHVRADPAAIGYVSDEIPLRGVKILDVMDDPSPEADEEADSSPKR